MKCSVTSGCVGQHSLGCLAEHTHPPMTSSTSAHTHAHAPTHAHAYTHAHTHTDTPTHTAGINPSLIVEAHGAFADAHCINCRWKYSRAHAHTRTHARTHTHTLARARARTHTHTHRHRHRHRHTHSHTRNTHAAGINPSLIVEAHGAFADAHCINCRWKYSHEHVKGKLRLYPHLNPKP